MERIVCFSRLAFWTVHSQDSKDSCLFPCALVAFIGRGPKTRISKLTCVSDKISESLRSQVWLGSSDCLEIKGERPSLSTRLLGAGEMELLRLAPSPGFGACHPPAAAGLLEDALNFPSQPATGCLHFTSGERSSHILQRRGPRWRQCSLSPKIASTSDQVAVGRSTGMSKYWKHWKVLFRAGNWTYWDINYFFFLLVYPIPTTFSPNFNHHGTRDVESQRWTVATFWILHTTRGPAFFSLLCMQGSYTKAAVGVGEKVHSPPPRPQPRGLGGLRGSQTEVYYTRSPPSVFLWSQSLGGLPNPTLLYLHSVDAVAKGCRMQKGMFMVRFKLGKLLPTEQHERL